MSTSYHPEPYWNEVARKIGQRKDRRLIAGDDEPYYRYQRNRFLKLFRLIPFRDRTVLEIGPGPGGNLLEAWNRHPRELKGADISGEMIAVSQSHLHGYPIEIKKIDGEQLPFPDRYFDLAYTSTVLQHNTDEAMLRQLVKEICRISRTDIYIFEKIEKRIRGNELCLGRPVSYYQQAFDAHGFRLQTVRYLDTAASYWVCGGIRKIFNGSERQEGEPASGWTSALQQLALPFTSVLDRLLPSRRGIAMLHFKRA